MKLSIEHGEGSNVIYIFFCSRRTTVVQTGVGISPWTNLNPTQILPPKFLVPVCSISIAQPCSEYELDTCSIGRENLLFYSDSTIGSDI